MCGLKQITTNNRWVKLGSTYWQSQAYSFDRHPIVLPLSSQSCASCHYAVRVDSAYAGRISFCCQQVRPRNSLVIVGTVRPGRCPCTQQTWSLRLDSEP